MDVNCNSKNESSQGGMKQLREHPSYRPARRLWR